MPIPSSPAARLAAIVLSLAAAYVALRVYPHELPAADRHPDFLATIFHSRALIFAGRITLLCLAAFVVFSIAARIGNREWLTKAGPFEVAQAATISESERKELSVEIAQIRRSFVTLTAALRESVGGMSSDEMEESP